MKYSVEDWKQSLSYGPFSFVLIRTRWDGSRKVIAYFVDNAEACNVCSAMNFYNEEIENLLKGAPE